MNLREADLHPKLHPPWSDDDPGLLSIELVDNIHEYFQFAGELGKGYSATTFEVISKEDHQTYALKIVRKRDQRLIASDKYYRDVYRLIPSRPCGFINTIFRVFEDLTSFYIQMELCTGIDLVEHVLSVTPGSLSTAHCKQLMFQICTAVRHLHEDCRVLHRDLKLDNILFVQHKDTRINLIDFDMCMFLDRADPPKPFLLPDEVSVVGTREYLAPEAQNGLYSERSDIWSLGVIFHILLDGHFPFDLGGQLGRQRIRSILAEPLQFDARRMAEVHGDSSVRLLKKMLCYDPKFRISSVWEILQSPWMVEIPNPRFCRAETSTMGSMASTKCTTTDEDYPSTAISDVSPHASPQRLCFDEEDPPRWQNWKMSEWCHSKRWRWFS